MKKLLVKYITKIYTLGLAYKTFDVVIKALPQLEEKFEPFSIQITVLN